MATGLKRTTIFLTPEQHEELRRLAFENKTSMAGLIREAVLEMLEDEEDAREGMKALAEDGGMDWEDFKKNRAKMKRNAVPNLA